MSRVLFFFVVDVEVVDVVLVVCYDRGFDEVDGLFVCLEGDRLVLSRQ